MEAIISKALSGNKSAITQLYNNTKDNIYSICFCLLQDKEKAEKIVIDVFSSVWKQISTEKIQSEADFVSLCQKNCIKEVKKIIQRNDSKAFQAPKNKNFVIESQKKASNWKEAIADFSTLQKFIFIVRVLCKMSPEQISKIVFVDTTTVKLAISAEQTNLDKVWSYNETEKSLLNDATLSKFSPNDSSKISPILESIEKHVEPFEKESLIKKIKIVSVVLAIALSIVIIYFLVDIIKNRDNSSDNTSKDNNVSAPSSTDVDWVTSVTATDYAVIDIKDYGKISVALDSKTAPITVANFKKLAKEGFYDGLTFHRIIEGFMMQGGDPEGTGFGGSDEEIKGEFLENGVSNNISHVRGAISMARSTPYDSASSQFFIVHEDSLLLNKKYAGFGYVVDGMDVVDKVCTEAEPTDSNGTIPAKNQPIINSIKIYTVEEYETLKENSDIVSTDATSNDSIISDDKELSDSEQSIESTNSESSKSTESTEK